MVCTNKCKRSLQCKLKILEVCHSLVLHFLTCSCPFLCDAQELFDHRDLSILILGLTQQSKEMKCNRHKSIRDSWWRNRHNSDFGLLHLNLTLRNLCASALSWRWEEPSHKGAFFAGTLMSSGPESNKCSQFTRCLQVLHVFLTAS